jgi:hypothetical protein
MTSFSPFPVSTHAFTGSCPGSAAASTTACSLAGRGVGRLNSVANVRGLDWGPLYGMYPGGWSVVHTDSSSDSSRVVSAQGSLEIWHQCWQSAAACARGL